MRPASVGQKTTPLEAPPPFTGYEPFILHSSLFSLRLRSQLSLCTVCATRITLHARVISPGEVSHEELVRLSVPRTGEADARDTSHGVVGRKQALPVGFIRCSTMRQQQPHRLYLPMRRSEAKDR